MSIFDYENYKDYVRDSVYAMPRNGRGEWGRIARKIGVNSTMVSQIFNGEKNLSLEQACDLIDYWGLNELESEYFLLLLQLERSGSHKLTQRVKKKLSDAKRLSQQIKHRIPHKKVLADSDQAKFYSHWAYAATRVLTSIPDFSTINSIADYLEMPVARTREIVEFLLATGLCVDQRGSLEIGTLSTHLEAQSILISSHHRNWRQKAIERSHNLADSELMFSGLLTVSQKDFEKLRTQMLDWIQDIGQVVEKSKPEKAAVLNIDLFHLKREP